MGQKVDKFVEDLRVKLTNAKSRFDGLKAKIDVKAQNAEQEVRSHLDQVQKRIEQDRTKVSAAQAEMKKWVEARKTATAAKIAEWKAKHESKELQNRVDWAERYAAASIDVALAAIDDAEQATLEAWLARQDANTVPAK
ncbi:MAG: hypothetical protein ACLPWS_17240 [Rhodomicrobium sp.]